ncbi:MAG: nitroreductase family protein [Pseudomonadota bacterium]
MSGLKSAMKTRVTEKVLVDPRDPLPVPDQGRDAIDDILADAAFAPFHYPCAPDHREHLPSMVPWRTYKFDAANCRALLSEIIDREEASIIRNMLAAADWLILATWTPDVEKGEAAETDNADPFRGTLRNMEHIAAGSAMIQNMLLLATEAGWRSYWSSGGLLKSDEIFTRCGIPTREILLGAVFLSPAEAAGDVDRRPGKLRDSRGAVSDWSRWVEIA